MSQFSFNDYQKAVSAAQSREDKSNIGYFKLADDGDEAIVRINISSTDDLQFATIHNLGPSTNYMNVSCLAEFGDYSKNACPLCSAVANGNASISKAAKRVYVPMLVSYKDRTTGQYSIPIPVIWNRPAGFSREIATKLRDYGDLRQVLLKIVRNGKKNDKSTTYSVDYAMPSIYKPEMIPVDFSAFNNFKLNKHSFWDKTLDEVNAFLATGAFPTAKAQVNASSESTMNTNIGAVNTTTPQNFASVATPINEAVQNQPFNFNNTPAQPAVASQAPSAGMTFKF